jgi:hypothetical protein
VLSPREVEKSETGLSMTYDSLVSTFRKARDRALPFGWTIVSICSASWLTGGSYQFDPVLGIHDNDVVFRS